jgi:hypothetical protein
MHATLYRDRNTCLEIERRRQVPSFTSENDYNFQINKPK